MQRAVAATEAPGSRMTPSEVQPYVEATVLLALTEALADMCRLHPANPLGRLSSRLLGATDCQRSVHSEIEAAFIQQLTDRHAVAKDDLNQKAPRMFAFQPTPSNVNAAAHGTVHRIPMVSLAPWRKNSGAALLRLTTTMWFMERLVIPQERANGQNLQKANGKVVRIASEMKATKVGLCRTS
jgi:hypothetical protein